MNEIQAQELAGEAWAAGCKLADELMKARVVLAALVKQIDAVRDSSEYRSVWDMAFLHTGEYKGPHFIKELGAARALIFFKEVEEKNE